MKTLKIVGTALVLLLVLVAVLFVMDSMGRQPLQPIDLVIAGVIVFGGYWFVSTGRLARLFRKV